MKNTIKNPHDYQHIKTKVPVNMSSIALWIQASRPKTLTASICPVLCGSALAFLDGNFHPLIFILTLLAALGIQVCTNFANDYFDFVKGADTASRKGPLRLTQAGLVSPATMQKAILTAFALTSLLILPLILKGGLPIALLSTLALVLAIAYTAGPFSLAYLGLGDLFVLLFFGPIATAFTYYLQTETLTPEAFLIGSGCGLLSTAILTVNNLRDIAEDRNANKKTLCVRLGKNFGKGEYTACLLLAPFCAIGYRLPLLTLIPAIFLIRTLWKKESPEMFNKLLAQTSWLLVLYTALTLGAVLYSHLYFQSTS